MKKSYLSRRIEMSSIFSNFLSAPVKYIILFLLIVVVVFPLFWLFICAFKYKQDFLAYPPVIIPQRLTLEHFSEIYLKRGIVESFWNSLIVSSASTAISLIAGCMAAYAICRGHMRKTIRAACAFWFLIQRMYPAIATAIPVYVVMRNLHLIDTRASLIIMNTSFNLPFVIWLMIGFFNEVPLAMEESAVLDGCNLAQRFFRIILPISRPGLVAAGILTFVNAWNEFLFAAILSIRKTKTLPVVISGFITDKGLEWGQMAAASAVIIIPVVLLVWAAQKDFVKGMMMGSVKE